MSKLKKSIKKKTGAAQQQLTMTMKCKKKKLNLRLSLQAKTENKSGSFYAEDDEGKYRKYNGKGGKIGHFVNQHQKNIVCYSMWIVLIIFATWKSRSNPNANSSVDDIADMSSKQLERLFADQRHSLHGTTLRAFLETWRDKFDSEIENNVAGGTRWARPYLLPGVGGIAAGGGGNDLEKRQRPRDLSSHDDRMPSIDTKSFFYIPQTKLKMKWQEEWKEMVRQGMDKTPVSVDYTDKEKYAYTPISEYYNDDNGQLAPSSQYPKMKSLKKLMDDWPQDEDYHGTIHETIVHFDYNDPEQLEIAKKFRHADLPYKIINIPELVLAGKKWDDDEYVAQGISHRAVYHSSAEESQNNFFMSFTPGEYRDWWDIGRKGVPPVRFVPDLDYITWARHARFADASRLPSDKPHYYWQFAADGKERFVEDKTKVSFIARDLPSFSSPNATFFVPNPHDNHRGIQCRFGERGVVSWIHIDITRNHIAMLSGARRYILSPPRECNKFGFTDAVSKEVHLSALNLGNLNHLKDDKSDDVGGVGMSDLERYWLGRAGQARAVETVLKEGEVLFVPSFWLHYLVNLQKSSQCSCHMDPGEGHPVFGTLDSFAQCKAESKAQMI